jgi:hypothetical protein
MGLMEDKVSTLLHSRCTSADFLQRVVVLPGVTMAPAAALQATC